MGIVALLHGRQVDLEENAPRMRNKIRDVKGFSEGERGKKLVNYGEATGQG